MPMDDAHISPALAALDLISEHLPADKSSVSVEDLHRACAGLSKSAFRDGLRILAERGVIRFVSGGEGEGARISVV